MEKDSSNEILFQRVLERLIIDEILLQKAKKIGSSDQELNEALANFADQDGLSLKEFKEKLKAKVNILYFPEKK